MIFLVVALAEIIAAVPLLAADIIGASFLLAVPAHLIGGVKRFYGGPWPKAVLKSLVVGALYLVVLTGTLFGLLILSILNL